MRSLVTATLATVSYLAIERPVRRHGIAALRRLPRKMRGLAAVVVASLAGVTIVALVLTTAGAQNAGLTVSSLRKRNVATRPNARDARVLMLGDSQMFTLDYWASSYFTIRDCNTTSALCSAAASSTPPTVSATVRSRFELDPPHQGFQPPISRCC